MAPVDEQRQVGWIHAYGLGNRSHATVYFDELGEEHAVDGIEMGGFVAIPF